MKYSTPLMEQYLAIKKQSRDAVLFFRMGDFYEMFFEDAQVASRVLGLTLTARGHGKSGDVPLAGFPYHALDDYLAKMLKAGHRVAICEQVEDPKQAKGVVKREIIERLSPGTAYSDNILDGKRHNYFVSLLLEQERAGLAALDISTGDFFLLEGEKKDIISRVKSYEPSEILLQEDQEEHIREKIGVTDALITGVEHYLFSHEYAYESLVQHYETSSLKGFGCEDAPLGISAAGALLHYLKFQQSQDLSHITQLHRIRTEEYMILDEDTIRNLELIEANVPGRQSAALIHIIDGTRTVMGARLLREWFLHPLRDIRQVNGRLEAVEELKEKDEIRLNLEGILSRIGDLHRIVTKFFRNRATARDLLALNATLKQVPSMQSILEKCSAQRLQSIRSGLHAMSEITEVIDKAIVETAPISIHEGGMFREGYNAELDDLLQLSRSGKDWIIDFQQQERDKTGIPSLKIGYNKVFGYYIEVSNTHSRKVPDTYHRKQTLVNAERYITPELKEYEDKILHAEEQSAQLEYRLFHELRDLVITQSRVIQQNGNLLAELDCYFGFAVVAVRNHYHRPVVVESDTVTIHKGRHPVVEELLPAGEQFISNDVKLDIKDEQILIITGPNMSGKSTFLRQVGLIIFLAQVGSFVPAEKAEIGVVDRIFTRVGAADNLAGGESTFLVEMHELANILNNATRQSLILLDEIGRGTSTFDGLAIAWAASEYLHNQLSVAAKTIFATHYHELVDLERLYPRIKNYNATVKEWGDSVVFLRKIEKGGCDRSYGIHVARMAGIPREVLDRSREILRNLEANELTPEELPKIAMKEPKKPLNYQINLFQGNQDVLNSIKDMNLDEITPLGALQKLHEYQKRLKDS